MDYKRIACFDVYYYEDYAKACSVVFQPARGEKIISEYCEIIRQINDYIPGEFYKRELPCILRVYSLIKEDIDLAIVDGFVMLEQGKKGLGGYLFEALGKKIPVVGVAKTYFMGSEDYVKVYRGISKNSLYISSIGVDLDYAAELIKTLEGKNRIPDVLKRVDSLTRIIGESLGCKHV